MMQRVDGYPWGDGRAAGAGRRGFTLVELLVVVAIIVVLLAILVPSLAKARRQAKSVSCAARLRSLAQATYLYRADWRCFLPTMYDSQTNYVPPHDLKTRVLNVLAPYMSNFPPIPTTNPQLSDVPKQIICPFVQEWYAATGLGPYNGDGAYNQYWRTGYGYYYGIDQGNYDRIVKPGRCLLLQQRPDANGPDGVLWADAISYYSSWGNKAWYYSHVKYGRAPDANFPFFHDSSVYFDGANIGCVDGSVVWRAPSYFPLGLSVSADLANMNTTASFINNAMNYHWWF